jgi:glucuronosyltransferase
MKSVYLVLLLLFNIVFSFNILILFPFPYFRNFVTFEPLFRNLAEIGHNVTVVSHFSIRDPPKTYKEVFLNYTKHYEEGVERFRIFRRFSQLNAAYELFNFSVDNCKKFLKIVQYDGEFDVTLIDFSDDCSVGLIYKYSKSSIVALSPGYGSPWQFERTSYQIPGRKLKFAHRFENLITSAAYRILRGIFVRFPLWKIFRRHFGGDFSKLEDMIERIDLVLTNTHSSMGGVYAKNANSIEVGGIHIRHTKLPEVSKSSILIYKIGIYIGHEIIV